MKTNYQVPQIEVVEIELEGVLCTSGTGSVEDLTSGGSIGDW
ncbi:MAG: hypothetical protein SNH94_00225 [Rikenellaceae bacterium]